MMYSVGQDGRAAGHHDLASPYALESGAHLPHPHSSHSFGRMALDLSAHGACEPGPGSYYPEYSVPGGGGVATMSADCATSTSRRYPVTGTMGFGKRWCESGARNAAIPAGTYVSSDSGGRPSPHSYDVLGCEAALKARQGWRPPPEAETLALARRTRARTSTGGRATHRDQHHGIIADPRTSTREIAEDDECAVDGQHPDHASLTSAAPIDSFAEPRSGPGVDIGFDRAAAGAAAGSAHNPVPGPPGTR